MYYNHNGTETSLLGTPSRLRSAPTPGSARFPELENQNDDIPDVRMIEITVNPAKD